MTTALLIIERAFSKIGVRAAETPLTNSETQDGLDILNDLLSEWGTNGELQGAIPVENVTDDLVVPRYSLGALKANVAIRLASEYDREVTQGLAFDATNSKNAMVKAGLNLRVFYPSTLPTGSGNTDENFGLEREFFPDQKKQNF